MLLTEPPLPRRVIEPLKLALAIAIIYAISFYMGWGKPYWATVSAISVNLLSTGLTLHRGVIRTLGTAIGGFAGMALIGIFPQERWAYITAAAVVLFVLGYKATGKKEPYGYLIILITFIVVIAVVQNKDYTDSGNAFSVVMLRVTQTWMGSLVMILIMVYVYPYRTVDEFEEIELMRWGHQRQLYGAYRSMLFGEAAAGDTRELRLIDAPLGHLSHFKLHGAEQDTFEMEEFAHDWHHYLHLTVSQYEALEALRQSLGEVRDMGLDLTKYLPNLEAVDAEIDRRFEQTERILGRKPATYLPHHLEVELDEDAARALPHFQEAAVRVVRQQLADLEAASLSLFDTMAKIRELERPHGAHDDHHGHGHGEPLFALDPFRLRTTAAFVTAVVVAFIIWILVYDMPRQSLYTCFVVITASILAYRPEMNYIWYGAAWMLGGIIAGPLYVVLMHQATNYLAFAAMVVVVVFLIQYWLYPHMHPVPRIFTTIGFTIVIDAENHQHYDMQHYLQSLLWMGTAIATTLVVRFAYFPWRPDKLFLKSLEAFFRHAEFLLSAYDAEGRPDRSLSRRIRAIFYRHSLLEEADRLALYAGQLDPRTGVLTYQMVQGATPEQMQDFVRSVFALGHRVEALAAARAAWHSNAVDMHVMDEKRDWLEATQEWFRRIPGEAQLTGPEGDLQARLERLETRIDEAFAQLGKGELSTEDYENFYHRLGHYRGLSEAAADYVRAASAFDWPRWREVRF